VDCIEAFCKDAETIDQVKETITQVFAGKVCPKCGRHYGDNEEGGRCYNKPCQTEKDPINGYPMGPLLVTPRGVLFSSVHRAKGLEAQRVFIIRNADAPMPHPMAKLGWERVQENNLVYVAITRAIHELVWVT
jgi:hypothetical protein